MQLSKSEVQCKSYILWHRYRSSVPKDKILSLVPAPYFIQGTESNEFFNAIGLVGLILLADSNLENQITGFNTFISLYAYERLLDFKVIKSYADNGYQIYPIIVDSVNDLLKVINIADPTTKLALEQVLNIEMPIVDFEAISTSTKYSDHLRGLTSVRYNSNYTLVISGMVYLLMFKELNFKNYAYYMKKWWLILCHFLGIRFCEEDPVTYTLMPPHEACMKIYEFYSANKSIRELLFVAIDDNIREETDWNSVRKAIRLEASFAELEHINLIIKHIVIKNPSVLAHKILSNEVRFLTYVLKMTENVNEFQFVNIFWRDELPEELKPHNFPKLIYIANNLECQSGSDCMHGVCMPNFSFKGIQDDLDKILNSLRSNSADPAARNVSNIQKKAIEELIEASEHWKKVLVDIELHEERILSHRSKSEVK